MPSSWERTSFGKLAEFRNGLNFTKANQGESIKIVGVGDFKDHSSLTNLDNLNVIKVANTVKDNDLIESNDVLYVRSNGNKNLIGRCLFFPHVTEKLSFSGFTIRGRVTSRDMLPDYLALLSRSQIVKQQFLRNGGGTNISNLSQQILNDLIVPLPPLPEQRKIAKILSTWDKAISATEKLIETSKQQKKALMQQLLTGKNRLINPETSKAFEGEWEEVKLDDLALYRRGSFPQPYGNPEWVDEVNGYPFIQVFDIDKNMKLKKATKTKISDAAIDKSVFIEAGTVIVSLQGSIGRVAITQYDAYVDRTVLLFQSFKRKMDTIYFAYAIQELFEIEKEKAPGGTIKTITKQVLSNFTIKVPAHYEQQKIATVLTAADKEIEVLGAKLAHFKQEKKALMQQLLTGKRRVKIDEIEAA